MFSNTANHKRSTAKEVSLLIHSGAHVDQMDVNQFHTQLQGTCRVMPQEPVVPQVPSRSAFLYKKRRKNWKLKDLVWPNVK